MVMGVALWSRLRGVAGRLGGRRGMRGGANESEGLTAEEGLGWVRAWVVGGGVVGALAGASVVAAYASTGDDARTRIAFRTFSALTPLFQLVDGETAHATAVWAANIGLVPRERRPPDPRLATSVWGLRFPNPLGMAAGFDKDAVCVDGLLGMGFGSVEVGSITPLPQPGNPRPRVFRLPELGAYINRYGFNSQGASMAKSRLRAREEVARNDPANRRIVRAGVLGVNLGKNKEGDAEHDYVHGIKTLGPFADYLVINISSPNTPGLRNLQRKRELTGLLRAAVRARDALEPRPGRLRPPLLVKIAPDLTDEELADIAGACLGTKIDGIVVSNTTVSRDDAVRNHKHGEEGGGLSGAPLMEPSTAILRKIYALTRGKIPLVGCGGVASGRDAYTKIRAGASLVQLYSAFALQGPEIVPRIKQELAECLKADGFRSVQDAVGADFK